MSLIVSLCSGIGTLDDGVQWALAEHEPDEINMVGWFSEFNETLADWYMGNREPWAEPLGDLTKVNWAEVFPKKAVNRTNNDLAEVMYFFYLQGSSLAEVGKMFGRSRQSVYEVFKYRELPLRGKNFRPTVEWGGQTYTIGSQGYYRRTSDDRSLLHRDIWESTHGPIPEGHDIHHVDHNKTNNAIENLTCLTKADHARLHAAEAKGGDALDSRDLILTAGYP